MGQGSEERQHSWRGEVRMSTVQRLEEAWQVQHRQGVQAQVSPGEPEESAPGRTVVSPGCRAK